MKLTVSEAATFLGADDARVTAWIEDDGLPAQRIRGNFRINRADLLEWATAHDVPVAPRAFQLDRGTPSLAGALRAGGVSRGVPGSDQATVIRAVVARLPLADPADRDLLLHILLARESLGVTAVGDGIAIPHVRAPIILAPAGAVLSLSFLAAPLEVRAPDGLPIEIVFLLICPTVHVHLAMLAKLASALRDTAFRAAVRERASFEEIVAMAGTVEGEFG